MPFFADPSSTCQICMEPYVFSTQSNLPSSSVDQARAPHAIGCGHIFCRRCLDELLYSANEITYNNRPPICPLCRHPFEKSTIIHLFVDTVANAVENSEPVALAHHRLKNLSADMYTRQMPGAEPVDAMREFFSSVAPREDNEGLYANAVHALADLVQYYIQGSRQIEELSYKLANHRRTSERDAAQNDVLVEFLMDRVESVEGELERYTAIPSVSLTRRYAGSYTSPPIMPAANGPPPGSVPGVVYVAGPPRGQGVYPSRTRHRDGRSSRDARLRKLRLEEYRARAAAKVEEDESQLPVAANILGLTDRPQHPEALTGVLFPRSNELSVDHNPWALQNAGESSGDGSWQNSANMGPLGGGSLDMLGLNLSSW